MVAVVVVPTFNLNTLEVDLCEFEPATQRSPILKEKQKPKKPKPQNKQTKPLSSAGWSGILLQCSIWGREANGSLEFTASLVRPCLKRQNKNQTLRMNYLLVLPPTSEQEMH